MSQDVFLTFQDNSFILTPKKLFTSVQNTFTIEFWAKPFIQHGIEKQTKKGISSKLPYRFVMTPVYGALEDGNSLRAGVGVSVGTNGVSVYEHSLNYLPATLVHKMPINEWTHIAVVYINKTPYLYINGEFIKKGLTSSKSIVVPSGVFGRMAPFGSFVGNLREVRIWSTARTKPEIITNVNKSLTGNEPSLIGYWKLDEGSGTVCADASQNRNNGTISGAMWKTNTSMNLPNQTNKVLFVYYLPSGGVETLNRQRYYALSKKGIICHFLYTLPGTGLQNKIGTSIFVTNNELEMQEIIRKGDYEAIIVNSDFQMLKKIKGFGYKGSLIYEIQGLGYSKEHADYVLKYAFTNINNYCDAFLYPPTPHLVQAIESNFPHKKKYCFDNCFNMEEFSYRVHPLKDKPIIGWIGRIEENKNWKDFLLIGAELIKWNPMIQLWMFEDNTIGDKLERIAFEKTINELNIRNNLTIFSNQPHSKMADHLSIIGDSGGFLCSTSKVEGFGYAVLEAMVCKCPVLSTDSDGVRSFIKHNETGKFFQISNIQQAVLEAKDLMMNNGLREKIRLKGLEHIKANFSLDKYAENFLNMLHSFRR